MKTITFLILFSLVSVLTGCSSVDPASRQQAANRKAFRKAQHDHRVQMAHAVKEKNRPLREAMPPGPPVVSVSVGEDAGSSPNDSGQN